MGLLFRSSSSFLESQTKLWESVRSTQNESEKSVSDDINKITTITNNNKETISQNNNLFDSKTDNKDEDNCDNNLQWYDKYSPKTVDDVCIHKRKIRDVEQALMDMLSNYNDNTRILLLTGPSGCGKSTLIKRLGEKLVPLYRYKNRDRNKTMNIIDNFNSGNDQFGRDCVIEYEISLELNHIKSFNAFFYKDLNIITVYITCQYY